MTDYPLWHYVNANGTGLHAVDELFNKARHRFTNDVLSVTCEICIQHVSAPVLEFLEDQQIRLEAERILADWENEGGH